MTRSINRFMITLLAGSTMLFCGNASLLKMDAALRHLLSRGSQSPLYQQTLHGSLQSENSLYILAEGENCRSAIFQQGGSVVIDCGHLVSAYVPLNAMTSLACHPDIQHLSLPHRYRRHNDMLTADIRADQVFAGASPLSQSYTGRGVIIGIIDTGIDVTHPDFIKSDGQSRILAIWDQNISGNPPSGYEYGYEWTQSDINNGSCSHTDPYEQGHGTHVSGIAAGNGRATGAYRGVAPEADIIVVADNPEATGGFIDGVNYIFSKADALGRPCVINASLGSHQGGHDGSDLESRMLDQLVTASPGRVLCASAGNEGDDFIHLSYPATEDSFYTYVYPGSDGLIMLYIRLPNDVLNQVHFAIGWDEHNFNPFTEEGGPVKFGGRTPWFSVQETVDNIGFYERANSWDGQEVGRVSFEFDTQNDSITVLRIIIEDDLIWDDENEIVDDMDLWRFMVWQPDDRMDAWLADFGSTYPGTISQPGYRDPDNNCSVGIPAAARQVIAVGATVNRETYMDQFGDSWIYSDEPEGSLALFSSRGPTADHRIKPDIAAPGQGVISCLSAAVKNAGTVDETDIVQGGRHVISSGTSMSCPAVTGCIALYLEKYPGATAQQIYQAVTGTARQDDDTGAILPDNNWGYGKIDAFSMLSHATGIPSDLSGPGTFFLSHNYPNPFNDQSVIYYRLPNKNSVHIRIYDIRGRELATLVDEKQEPGTYRIQFDGREYASGVYLCRVAAGSDIRILKMALIK